MSETINELRIVKRPKTKKSAEAETATQHVWTFDFAGCTVEQIADKAASGLVIDLQDRFRHGKPVPRSGSVVKVADMLAGRRIVDPETEIGALFAGLTDEQRAAVLKRLGSGNRNA